MKKSMMVGDKGNETETKWKYANLSTVGSVGSEKWWQKK